MKQHDNKPNTPDWEAVKLWLSEFHDFCYVVGTRTVRCFKQLLRFTNGLWHPLRSMLKNAMAYGRELFTAKRYQRIRIRILQIAAPVMATALLLATVVYWSGANYAVALGYNGAEVGYIADESVYTDAAVLVREAVINTDGSFKMNASPVMTITVAEPSKMLNKNELRDRLLSASQNQITHAYGLFVGGEFCGAMPARGTIETVMRQVLQPYESKEFDGVDFLNPWKIVEGLYPVDALCTAETLKTALEAQPVKNYINITFTETVKYSVVQVVDTAQPLGYESVTTKGRDGLRRVEAQIVYVDGEERYSTVMSAADIRPVVNQVITVGAQTYTDTSIIGDGKATGTFVWPLPYTKRISSYFASRWGSFHGAIDIADGRTHGKPIIASDGGVVVEAEFHSSYGNYVLIDHGNGFLTRYAHCSVLEVQVGDKVAQGQYIAKVGDTGYVTGSHLHFEVIKRVKNEEGKLQNVLVDPLDYVQR